MQIQEDIEKFKQEASNIRVKVKKEQDKLSKTIFKTKRTKRKFEYVSPLISDLIEAKKALDKFNSKLMGTNIVSEKIKIRKPKKNKKINSSVSGGTLNETSKSVLDAMLEDDFFDENNNNTTTESFNADDVPPLDTDDVYIKKEHVSPIDTPINNQSEDEDIVEANVDNNEEDDEQDDLPILESNVKQLKELVSKTIENTRNVLESTLNQYYELFEINKRNIEMIDSQADKLQSIENGILKQFRAIYNQNYVRDVPLIFGQRDLHTNSLNINPFMGS